MTEEDGRKSVLPCPRASVLKRTPRPLHCVPGQKPAASKRHATPQSAQWMEIRSPTGLAQGSRFPHHVLVESLP